MKVAIASGKGGTGKTIISTNLTKLISENQHITLVDLDVEEPNSGHFINAETVNEESIFKLVPDWDENVCSFCGQCQSNCNFNATLQLDVQIIVFPELCHSCFACSELCPENALPMKKHKIGNLTHFKNSNLDFIEGRLDIGEEQAVPLISQTNKFIKNKTTENELVIIDSPPGTSCPVIETVKDADLVLLVSEPTPFGLHDLKLSVKTMKKLGKDFAVILNRSGIGNNEIYDYCKSQNIKIIAEIHNDRKVAELYANGKLVYEQVEQFKNQMMKIKNYIDEKS